MAWYYSDGTDRWGPVSEAEFCTLVARGTIRDDTLVWRDGLPAWQTYGHVATPQVPPLPPEYAESAPSLRYAGFWIRLAAKFIDFLILAFAGGIAGGVLGALLGVAMGEEGLPVIYATSYLLGLLIRGCYHIFFVAAKGATPGKMLLNLKIVRADGSPVGDGQAAARWCAASLNYLTLWVGWIIAAFDSEKRGLHDRICDTRVIHDD